MGQATVDLPDPMRSPAAPATAGTDDLLAQLAGDEIERLLAETETERPAAARSAAAAMSAAPARQAAAPARETTASARETTAPAQKTTTVSPPPPAAATSASAPLPTKAASESPDDSAISSEAKENLTTQLDALFESLDEAATPPAKTTAAVPAVAAPKPSAAPGVVSQKAPAAPAAPASPAPAAPPAPAAAPASESLAEPADTASSSAELKALGEPIPVSDAVAADAAALAQTLPEGMDSETEETAPPSLLVRILEFINAPLARCSDPVRQAVGKIAIATLLNAIAVLVYTLVFRHR